MGTPPPVELGLELGAAAVMVAIAALVHGLGLIGISRLLHLRRERRETHSFDVKAIFLMGGVAMLLFLLHAVEIWIYGAFYLAIHATPTLEAALFLSGSAYATLGYTIGFLPDGWRLVPATEALAGFLLLGWSTAFLVNNINKMKD